MSKQIERRFLQANGEVLTVELERKSVKRLNLRVREDGSVHLSIPNRLPMAEAERFLQRQLPWIAAARLRMRSRKKADFSPVEGATLPVLGVPRTLHIVKGARPRYLLGEDALTLWVSDPEDKAACNAALRRFVKAESRAALTARVEAIYPRFSHRPATFPVLSFRWMRSRWGSCTAKKGHITLNQRLLFAPIELIDYVIYHELCHFRHQDHSRAFYALLSQYVPDYKEARAALKNYPLPDLDN